MFKVKDKVQKAEPAQRKTKKKTKIIVFLILAIVLVAGGSFVFRRFSAKKVSETGQTSVVTRGDISKTIEGTGTIEAIEQYTVTSLVTGEVLNDYFEVGDVVSKGDLLYTIDSSDLENSIERAEHGVESARLNYDDSLKAVENTKVTAPISGVITELKVKNGDNVNNGGQIATLVNSDEMILTITFNAKDAIHTGDHASVILQNSFAAPLSGTVKTVSSGSIANSNGVLVKTVEILVKNPGGIIEGNTATATVGSYACNEAGTFSYSETAVVTAKVQGEVKNLTCIKGDKVNKGDLLLTIESDSTNKSVRQSELSLKDSQLNLKSSYEQLENYRITSPITGKVISKTVKAGDKLGDANTASEMAIIADLSTLTFDISVDELDISSIKEGQQVQITADAVSDTSFTGYVDNVSIVGTSTNGVTSYPVTIVLDGNQSDKLIPGMNVTARIVVESRKDVLKIPVSAISRGNRVTVKGEVAKPAEDKTTPPENKGNQGAPKLQEAPAGYHYVIVKTGLSDGDYIEVVSGLKEGDVVLLPDISSSTTFEQQMQGMRMNMGGGAGRQMPAGGMGGGPSGGSFSGGNRSGAMGGSTGSSGFSGANRSGGGFSGGNRSGGMSGGTRQ